ncbi:MAG: GTPase Era [Chloroflexi bacterium]|nr:GTPase Era [Chloroflexota bacterium]
MLPETLPEDYRAGFVALAGRPNVGKSTLMNALLGQKVAAVSPRPQTTRKRQLGILTTDRGQIVFVDAPGIHKAHHKLGEAMNYEALATWEDVDLILFMVDGAYPPHEEDRMVAQYIRETAGELPTLIVFNKVDLTPKDRLEAYQAMYQELLPDAPLIPVSALTGEGLDALLDAIFERLPVSPPYYDEDTITDLTEREIAADLIREAALLHLRDEVPHAMAVRIDEYKERGDHGAYIAATLFVERDSQKGIVIGKGGTMLKQIGTTARQAIEAMSGRKVFLDLRVKVRKNWRNDPGTLRQFGFRLPSSQRKRQGG